MFAVLCNCLATSAQVSLGDGVNRWNLFAPASSPVVDTKPHPAVVRVTVDEGRLTSSGSGSFVAFRDQHGLVVTNWHVVRDAKGPVQVVFPDGFRSEAQVLKTDQDWDLAALMIWRPKVEPIKIGSTAPQPGDMLTIAGYGSGDYRAVSGRCTQYLAPSVKHPYEFVELSARARQGDSGGPIFNDRGELAGVLFGADRATTSGSYCGRVRWFLSSVWPEIDTGSVSAVSAPQLTPPGNATVAPLPNTPPLDPPPMSNLVPIPSMAPAIQSPAATDPEPFEPFEPGYSSPAITLPPLPTTAASTPGWNWNELAGTTRWDHAKSILAVIGLLAIWRHLTRALS